MYKKLFLDISIIIFIIAMFGYIMSVYLNIIQIPFIRARQVYEQTIYELDIMSYIRNLEIGFTNLNEMNLSLPGRVWNYDYLWPGAIVNDLAYMLDWGLLFVINLIIYPIRILAYILRGIFVLLGSIPYTTTIKGITYHPQWYMSIFNVLMSLQIPYV